jgi:hypothetical protein
MVKPETYNYALTEKYTEDLALIINFCVARFNCCARNFYRFEMKFAGVAFICPENVAKCGGCLASSIPIVLK